MPETVTDEGLAVRLLRLTDLERVYAIERAAFPDPWSRANLVESFESPEALAYGAERAGELVGYIIGWACGDEAEIGTFAVAEAARGQGVGARLLSRFLAELVRRKVAAVHLEVRRSAAPARRLYRRFGFVVTGLRRRYYVKENEDALIMSLSLKEG